jgi:hypothetical protein
MNFLIDTVINYLQSNPELDENVFLSEFEKECKTAVNKLQFKRRNEYVVQPGEILITNKESIDKAFEGPDIFSSYNSGWATPDMDTDSIFKIIINEIKYDHRFIIKSGSIILKRNSKTPLQFSPYDNDTIRNIACSLSNMYRNDDYQDDKGMELESAYRDFIRDALHVPGIPKNYPTNDDDYTYQEDEEEEEEEEEDEDEESDENEDKSTDLNTDNIAKIANIEEPEGSNI